jgi:hypothetical protein
MMPTISIPVSSASFCGGIKFRFSRCGPTLQKHCPMVCMNDPNNFLRCPDKANSLLTVGGAIKFLERNAIT